MVVVAEQLSVVAVVADIRVAVVRMQQQVQPQTVEAVADPLSMLT